jgi:mannosyltransferase
MRLVVDGIIYSLQTFGGISVYFNEILTRLDESSIEVDVVNFAPQMGKPPRFKRLGDTLALMRPFERYRRFDWDARTSKDAVFHSSYYRVPSNLSIPSVVTVHDFAYERSISGPRKWIHSAQKNAAIRSAQAIICISNSTRDDLMEFAGVRTGQSVHVIHNGSSEGFRPILINQSDKPFLLFVGQRGRYKNFHALLRAMAMLPDLELRCVGGGLFSEREFVGIQSEVRRRVRHEGFVSDDGLNILYNQARCLVYPSSYEGFGIPVIEAMRAGCPVVSINCKAVREVGGPALVVAESLEPHDLSEAIRQACSPVDKAGRVQTGLKLAAEYSWDITYTKTLNVYRSLLD